MSEAGAFTLIKALIGGVSAVLTGPSGDISLPERNLERALTADLPAVHGRLSSETGRRMGWIDVSPGRSPGKVIPDVFLEGLVATEDARFREHPGVDPFAVISAAADLAHGTVRGGSSLVQQSVKNAITGSDRTLDRKITEAIISVRAVSAIPREKILDGYLANAWFGRGGKGATSAARRITGKPWGETETADAALLVGMLKGPADYDPLARPEAAIDRRRIVLRSMRRNGVITEDAEAAANAAPLPSPGLLEEAEKWTGLAVERDLGRVSMSASDEAELTLTIRPRWQKIVQDALETAVTEAAGKGPAGSVTVDGRAEEDVLKDAARLLTTTETTGRAIVMAPPKNGEVTVLVDRGYGAAEEDVARAPEAGAKPGDVFAYRRTEEGLRLVETPRANGAAVVMEARTGAILASVGGARPKTSDFDRTQALRQPGSAIKPFLWARALEAGVPYDEMISDTAETYVTPTGETWTPRNYDGSETGLIPLFVGLEESSNQVAARLVSRLGTEAFAEVTELAGVYPRNGMRRHPSSALGASGTSLTRLVAGYAAIANGGTSVTPHVIARVNDDPVTPEKGAPVMTRRTSGLLSSMTYGVTSRGTAAGAFGSPPPIAGKTGTTQDYRDTWFVGFTPDIVVGVWIGRDDNASLPGRPTGASTAAPVVRDIIDKLQENGLTKAPGRLTRAAWPPDLLEARRRGNRRYTREGAIIYSPDSAPENFEGDPFKNRSTLIDEIRSDLGGRETDDANASGGAPTPRENDAPDWATTGNDEGYLGREEDPLDKLLR